MKITINKEKPKKCKHCRKTAGEHHHPTQGCPEGKRTRIGYIRYSKTQKYEEK